MKYEFENADNIFYQIAVGRSLSKNAVVWHNWYFEECLFEQAAINTACYFMAASDYGLLTDNVSGEIKSVLFDIEGGIGGLYNLEDTYYQWNGNQRQLAVMLYMAFGKIYIKYNGAGEDVEKMEKLEDYEVKPTRVEIKEVVDEEEEANEEWGKIESLAEFRDIWGRYFGFPKLRNNAKQVVPQGVGEDGNPEKREDRLIPSFKGVRLLYLIQQRAGEYINEYGYIKQLLEIVQGKISEDIEGIKDGEVTRILFNMKNKIPYDEDYVLKK